MKEKLFKVAAFINEYSLYALLFFIPIAKGMLESFCYLAIFCFIIKKIIKPDFSFIKTRFNLFLGLFILFSALSLINSGVYIEKSVHALFFKWLKFVLVFFMFQDVLQDRRRANKAIFVFLISASLVALDGIFQLFTGFDFFRLKKTVDMGNGVFALGAAFNNYNSLGAYLIISISLIMALVSRCKEMKKVIFYWFILILSCITLIFSYSRGGWFGFSISLVLFIIFSKNRKLLFFISIFFVIILSVPMVRDRFLLIFSPGGDTNRFETWQIAVDMIKQKPILGKGLGTFMDYFPVEKTWLIKGYAHNCFLQIWAESGIFSLVSFVLFLCFLFMSGAKYFLKKNDILILGLLCGLFGFVAHSFFDVHFYSLQLAYLFWPMAGILASLIRINEKES